MKRIFTIPLFLIVALSGYADFNFSANCKRAHEDVFALKLTSARYHTSEELKTHAENGIPHLINNYADFVSLFISEDDELLQKLSKNEQYRLEELKKNDPASPFYLYSQAEIKLQWAIAKLKYGEYTAAVFRIKDAHSLLIENKKYFPDFKLNNKSLGMLQVLIGSIPEDYKWVASMVGMEGNVTEGMGLIKNFIEDKTLKPEWELFRKEAGFMYAYLLRNISQDKKSAFELINNLTANYKTSLLENYIRGSVALYTGHTDMAIETFLARPKGDEFIKFSYLDYLLGLAKMYRNDSDADYYMKRFVFLFKGRTYMKEAYQKIAWCGLLRGDMHQYNTYMNLIKAGGKAVTGEDKQALKEAESGILPDVVLLRSRLYCDGAYYTNAIQTLAGKSTDDFKTEKDKCEFLYRKGRIFEEMEKYPEAISFLKQAIEKCGTNNFYFAPNGNLHIGIMYEKQGYKYLAKTYYTRAMAYKEYDYKQSVDQKAKAGIKRIEGK